ncbi:MAG: DUF2971 domain-containing protein [Terracidiphilus sp.]
MEAPEQKPNESTIDQSKPEELLYHYTTQEGLLGIIEKQKIWASHLQYLNDKSEGQIFTKLLLDEFAWRAATDPEKASSNITAIGRLLGLSIDQADHQNEALYIGSSAFSWITNQSTFVTSFSAHGNLLSQWRAYSGGAGGCSIGFRQSYLRSAGVNFLKGRKDGFYDDSDPLVACRYCDKPEEEGLKHKIRQIMDSYISSANQSKRQTNPETQTIEGKNHEIGEISAIAMKYFFPLGKQRAITKDQAFREEAEWRLVFQLERTGTTDSHPEFRPGRSMLTPYFKVPLVWENQPIGIKKIYVGPCPHENEAVKSVQLLLWKHDISGVDVEYCKIPYRNW